MARYNWDHQNDISHNLATIIALYIILTHENIYVGTCPLTRRNVLVTLAFQY